MTDEKKEVLEGLKPLFERAEREGLWFYISHRGLWFSPKELRKLHKEGRFLWGAVNWQLRPSAEMVEDLEAKTEALAKEIVEARKRIKND